MRTFSTPQSALNLEITKLAIVECILAVVLYVAVGLYLGSFKYLAVAVVFAPLMLFRTEESAIWGLNLYAKFLERLAGSGRNSRVIAYVVVVPLVGPAIRVVSTAVWAVRRPLYTLKETPNNWLRQTVCTDFAHVPEIVPLEAVRDEFHVPTFTRYVKLYQQEEGIYRIIIPVIFLPLVLIGWLPSLFYRVSFKATALVYAPLIWATHATVKNPLPLKARLERITKGELEKTRRLLSYAILAAVVAKLALTLGWIDLTYFISRFPSSRIAHSLVMVDRWPWWQFSLTIDALLTFFLLFFADAAITRIENDHTWPDDFVLNIVTSASFLRAVLSIVTITYFFYVALLAAFPSVVSRLSLS